MKIARVGHIVAGSLLCISIAGCIDKPAPPPPPPPPEVAAAIIYAKKVFISNVGEDDVATANLPGGGNACYNAFYASVKQWGHYQLVGSPKGADLVFGISATEKHWDHDPGVVGVGVPPSNRGIRIYPVIITLTVEDNLTRSTIWTTHAIAVTTANRRSTKVKQFNEAIDTLTDRLKAMGPVAAPFAPFQKQ